MLPKIWEFTAFIIRRRKSASSYKNRNDNVRFDMEI